MEARTLLWRVIVGCTLTLGAWSALAAPADAAQLAQGRFITVCKFSHQSMSDPIVYPGKPGKSHIHEFFGNASTNAYSTPRSLRHHKRTSCNPDDDRSGYWVPALEIGGKVVRPTSLRVYYSSGGLDPQSIQMIPRGLEMLAGDSHATSPQPTYVGGWTCYSGPLSDLTTGYVPAPVCPVGDLLIMVVNFPSCWDGRHLDSADHKSHLAYALPATLVSGPRCPASDPVPIPRISMRVFYPTNGASSGIELASGGIYSLHADFMDAWKRKELRELLDSCIRRARLCKAYGPGST